MPASASSGRGSADLPAVFAFDRRATARQRYRCLECAKTFSEPKPLARISTDPKKAAFVLQLLLEGMSVRAASRLTNLDKKTILRIMVKAGQQCYQFLADTMQNLTVAEIQCDEVWSFVQKKERTAFFDSSFEGCGDAYVFTARSGKQAALLLPHWPSGRGKHDPVRGQVGAVHRRPASSAQLNGRV
jgi:hypothetical protein